MTEDYDLEELNKLLLEKRKANHSEKPNELLGLMEEVTQKQKEAQEKMDAFKSTYQRRTCNFCGKEEDFDNETWHELMSNKYKQIEFKCSCDKFISHEFTKKKKEQERFINDYLPKRYKDKYFDDIIGNNDIIKQLKKLAKQYKSVYLTGNTGTGKTHCAIAYARELCSIHNAKNGTRYKPLITTLAEILGSLLDKENPKNLNYYKTTPVLIIDDIGSENCKEWAVERLFELINHRYSEDMVTIITTNLNAKELTTAIGARTFSRICELCEIMKFEGSDFRLKKFIKE